MITKIIVPVAVGMAALAGNPAGAQTTARPGGNNNTAARTQFGARALQRGGSVPATQGPFRSWNNGSGTAQQAVISPTPNMLSARTTSGSVAQTQAANRAAVSSSALPTAVPATSPFGNGITGANVNGLGSVLGSQPGILNPGVGVNGQGVFPGINTLPGVTTATSTPYTGGTTSGSITYNATTGQYTFANGTGTTGTITYNASTGQYVFNNGTSSIPGTITYDPVTQQYTFTGTTTGTNTALTNPYNVSNNSAYSGGYAYPGYNSYGYPSYGYAGYGGYGGSSGNGYTDAGLAALSNPALMARASLPQYRSVVPILGLTTPAAPLVGRVGASTRTRIVDGTVPYTRIGETRQRVAGSRQELRNEETTDEPLDVKASPMTRQQVTLVNRTQEIMADRPMTEGEVMAIGATGVQVKVRVDGEYRTQRYPVNEVFFFKESGEIATAAILPSYVHLGDRVLVAVPAEPRPASVAKYPATPGEVREDGSILVTPPPSVATSETVQEKVAGSRQTYSSGTVKQKVAGSRQTTRRRPAH